MSSRPANELGLRNVAFEVDDLQAAVDQMAENGLRRAVVGSVSRRANPDIVEVHLTDVNVQTVRT